MNRVRQLIWAITSRYKDIDMNLLNKYLNENELNQFNKLNNSEKQHCIRVCKDAIQYIINKNDGDILSNDEFNYIDIEKMAKIALMHDIGKIYKSLNIFQKCIVVILDKITSGKIKKYEHMEIIDIYYNHPKKSCELLKNIGNYDKEILDAIYMHHSHVASDSSCYLKLLKEMDNRN